jgi:hypothetical protein
MLPSLSFYPLLSVFTRLSDPIDRSYHRLKTQWTLALLVICRYLIESDDELSMPKLANLKIKNLNFYTTFLHLC